MSDNREHYHNKGQEDRASGKDYSPPNDSLLEVVINGEREIAERQSYHEGWENAKSQESK